jgi:enoyl-CoA hydratase
VSDVLLTEITDRVAVVTLNRPDRRNALDNALRRAILETLTELESDESVDVIVLTGADPAFCAGLDLKEIGAGEADFAAAPVARRGPIPPITKPLIGAVNGVAVTGGLELALNCDFLVASERARFADTHGRMGVMPGWGLSVLLPQAIGVRRARQMSFTGNYLDADTALSWGLVNEVVGHDLLVPRTLELAADIVSSDQWGVRYLRQTYEDVTAATVAEGWEIEADRARGWGGNRLDPAEVERRRRRVTDRGRSQL